MTTLIGREDIIDFMVKELDISQNRKFNDMRILLNPLDEVVASLEAAKLRSLSEGANERVLVDRRELDSFDTENPLDNAALEGETKLPVYTKEEVLGSLEFWKSIRLLARHHLQKSAKTFLTSFFEKKINATLISKSISDIDRLSIQVSHVLSNPDSGIDVDYWELLRDRLPVFRCSALLRGVRSQAQRFGAVPEFEVPGVVMDESELLSGKSMNSGWSPILTPLDAKMPEEWEGLEEVSDDAFQLSSDESDAESVGGDNSEVTFVKFVAREKERCPEDEVILEASEYNSGGETVGGKRPRYFNRVKTGFEWNRYNQTHYDQDSPPPKIVQGYKFALYYPELTDRGKPPTWKLQASNTPEDTVIIRFIGGSPYQDTAFEIVNREWDLNPKRGYRNCFERGILQLTFNFKRLRYRK